ncbi:MAG TPA: hypothetical protein VGA19_09340 [Rhodospirillales bacterium]
MKGKSRNRKEREKRLAALRREIARGRQSGEPFAYDPEAIKHRGRVRLALAAP